jgi:hypothetical protein
MDQLIGKFEEVLAVASGAKGQELKDVYLHAAGIIAKATRENLHTLPISPALREVLEATIIVNQGPEDKPNAIVGMIQNAAIKKLGKGRSIPNPAWFEYGTVSRTTGTGANRGLIHPAPVFRPAIERSRDDVTKALVDGIHRVLLP